MKTPIMARSMNATIGTGSSMKAITGEMPVAILDTKLAKPSAVAANKTGKMSACEM